MLNVGNETSEVVVIFFCSFSCRFFKQELQRETDNFRKKLLLREIQSVEQKISDVLRKEKEEMERENRKLKMILESLKKKPQ